MQFWSMCLEHPAGTDDISTITDSDPDLVI